jgi:2-methylcitrate dehydratase
MTVANDLAAFAVDSSWTQLSDDAVLQLKTRVLDALGCALGALDGEPIRMLGQQLDDFGGNELVTCIARGRTAPDRAALWNGALVRYLDFNDSYLAPGETCHPSDNLAPVLAAAEYADVSGREFLTALAVAYQVQCRLSDVAPVRARGFDHTTQGTYAVAAGVSRALGLDAQRTANAIAIAGTALNALRVTRTGALSHWKGLAYPGTAFGATHAAFLAKRGITGPPEVFEGNKGFMDAIAGPFDIDWAAEDLDKVRHTILKKYNAEIHSQAAIEGLLELRDTSGITARDVARIRVEIFDVAYQIIGGGEEGDKTIVRTKEEADHSLNYLLAVALLDGNVLPQQFSPERIASDDVQNLLRRVEIHPADDLSARFPDEHACRLTVDLRDGTQLHTAKRDYEGFHTRPMSWDRVTAKVTDLSQDHVKPPLLDEIIDAVHRLDQIDIRDLTDLLGRVEQRGETR